MHGARAMMSLLYARAVAVINYAMLLQVSTVKIQYKGRFAHILLSLIYGITEESLLFARQLDEKNRCKVMAF